MKAWLEAKGGWGRQIETLLAATAGGALLAFLHVPAGWLSGAMAAAAILTACGRGAQLAQTPRVLALALAGLALGSSVTPAMLQAFARYPVSLAMMGASLLVGTAAATWAVRKVSGWDRATCLFATIPGALSYVLALAPGAGADIARVSLVQLVRVFALIAVVPLLVGGGGGQIVRSLPDGPTDSMLWIVAILAFGVPLGMWFERIGVSAGVMFGPLLIAAIAHGTGSAPGHPPEFVFVAGQVMIGAWAGSRFHSFRPRDALRMTAPILVALAVTILVAALFAWATARILGMAYGEAMVAFAPGGLEAMTMLALALDLDPLYVGSHHLARFFMISFTLPFFARWLLGSARREE